MKTKKEHLQELENWNNKADKILRNYRKKGNDIEWALAWLIQLKESILERDFQRHNTAFIWFKNASKRSEEFDEVYELVCKMTSKIYLKNINS